MDLRLRQRDTVPPPIHRMSSHTGSKIAYMKMMNEHAEKTESGSDEMKQETIKYFQTKIHELEIDVTGSPRYSYNLRYATDFGREANGVNPEFAHKRFASTEDIVHFIETLILTDDMLYLSDDYNIPSPSKIDVMLSGDSRITRTKIDINADEDDDYQVPLFEITRTRVN